MRRLREAKFHRSTGRFLSRSRCRVAGLGRLKTPNAFATLNAAVAPIRRTASFATPLFARSVRWETISRAASSAVVRRRQAHRFAHRGHQQLARLQKTTRTSRNSSPLISLNRTFPSVWLRSMHWVDVRCHCHSCAGSSAEERRPQHRNGTDDQGADRALEETPWKESRVPIAGSGDAGEESAEAAGEKLTTEQRLEKLEHLLQEMSERLKSMEKRLRPRSNKRRILVCGGGLRSALSSQWIWGLCDLCVKSFFSNFTFLRFRNQYPQIPQIVPRRPGNDHVLES